MPPIRHILCPIDASEFSRRALRHAVAVGAKLGADVTVVSVRPLSLAPGAWLAAAGSMPDQREEWESTVWSFVRETAGAAVTQVILREGSVVPEILAVAGDLPADLVVMGTHGASGFERLLLGSVADRLLRRAPCPVLTVPRGGGGGAGAPAADFRTVVVGVDHSRASRQALETALGLAGGPGCRIVVVHALEDFAEEGQALSRHFNIPECRHAAEADVRETYERLVPEYARARCDVRVVIAHGQADRELVRIAAEWQATLLVIGTTSRGTLFGSTAQHVMRHAACPVLSVPGPAERLLLAGQPLADGKERQLQPARGAGLVEDVGEVVLHGLDAD